jgi:hypothetical protein
MGANDDHEMSVMTRARHPMVMSDDLPEAYLRRLLGDRIDHDAAVFSRVDALRQAEGERRRNPNSNHDPHRRPRRGRGVR